MKKTLPFMIKFTRGSQDSSMEKKWVFRHFHYNITYLKNIRKKIRNYKQLYIRKNKIYMKINFLKKHNY